MPELTAISGTLYDSAGNPVVGGRLTIKRVVKDGVLVSDERRDVLSVAGGAISFNVLRASTILVEGKVEGFTREVWLTVPDAETAFLENLVPATSPPSSAVTQAALNAALSSIVGEQPLTTTTIDLNSTAPQTLYTVPAGKRFMYRDVDARDCTADMSIVGDGISIAPSGGSPTFASLSHFDLTGPSVFVRGARPTGALPILTEGQSVVAFNGTAAGFDVTAKIDLYGVLVDA